MEIKLHPNNIQTVQYKLNGGKAANMRFDANGFLTDIDIEQILCSNPENDKAKQPLTDEFPKKSVEKSKMGNAFERSKRLMDNLFNSDGAFNTPKVESAKNDGTVSIPDEKIGKIKTSFDRFIGQWNEAGFEYWDKADEAKRDAKRDALITDFILDNKKVFSRGCVRALLENILEENKATEQPLEQEHNELCDNEEHKEEEQVKDGE